VKSKSLVLEDRKFKLFAGTTPEYGIHVKPLSGRKRREASGSVLETTPSRLDA
jgi:hypothetical protein